MACVLKVLYKHFGDGYLKRKPDLEDARAILFYLIPKGQPVRTRAQDLNYQFEQKWKQTLGPEPQEDKVTL